MRTLVCGDIHGARKALVQVLNRADYAPNEDRIVFIGDVADGWPEVAETFHDVCSMKNIIYIIGNHDWWLLDYFKRGAKPSIWTSQGGSATLDSYKNSSNGLAGAHKRFLEEVAVYYYVDEENRLYVHGGYAPAWPIDQQDTYDLMWDRDLYFMAKHWAATQDEDNHIATRYKEVFIGHTSTSRDSPGLKPVHASNVWNIDQGGGWEGKLTLMDVDTKEYWQSDIVKELYPNAKGR